jgi:hypothetical protein
MGESIQSSMFDGTDFPARLEAIEARLTDAAERDTPPGLTEPDPGDDERWEAAQVWAHMAEFVPYWQEQIQSVVAGYDGDPVPFGRVKSDPARVAAIEVGRGEPISELANRVRAGLAELKRYLDGLSAPEWAARGDHQTRGEMDVEAMAQHFLVGHLEEHLDQLDRLAADAAAGQRD